MDKILFFLSIIRNHLADMTVWLREFEI